MQITNNRLHELLFYNKETGVFVWKTGRFKNKLAGGIRDHGYVVITCDSKKCFAHRLAWMYEFGSDPDGLIDHINGDRSDNRIKNLRLATYTQNQINSVVRKQKGKDGLKGAFKRKHSGTWKAQIYVNSKCVYLGTFETEELAHKAYVEAGINYYGEYFYDGRSLRK